MGYDIAERPAVKNHGLNMENRAKLNLTGVEDVCGFDEHLVVLQSSMGRLTVRGEGLHIGRIDLSSGELEVSGKINELSYDELPQRGGFWSRLFG